MAKLRAGDILPWVILAGGVYVVYTNWDSIKGLFSGLIPSSGGGSPSGGGIPSGGGGGLPSGGGTPSGGGLPTGTAPPPGGVSSPPPVSTTPPGGTPATPSGPVTTPMTDQQRSDLAQIMANARQFCVDNYCYKCDEVGALGYQCAIVSGPGITKPLLVTKAGRPAFANSTGTIGVICDSKNNCWNCEPTFCTQISFEGGPPPTIPDGGQPGQPSQPISQKPPCAISLSQLNACDSETAKCIGQFGAPAGKQCQLDVWAKYPGCEDAQLERCCTKGRTRGDLQICSGQAASQPPPATQPTPATNLQLLQLWDKNNNGVIDDQDIIAANVAWTEGRLIPGASQAQQDEAVIKLIEAWTQGTQFQAGSPTQTSQQVIQAVQTRVTPGTTISGIQQQVGTPYVVRTDDMGGGIWAYTYSNGVVAYRYPGKTQIAYRYPDGRVIYQ